MEMIPQEALLQGKTRKLLNIDKLVFSSDITVWSTFITILPELVFCYPLIYKVSGE